jgi:hypothetical protein
LNAYPHVKDFITNHRHSFPAVKVSYKQGSAPNLILQGSEDEEETVRMDKWKIEDILEFLTSKLSTSK